MNQTACALALILAAGAALAGDDASLEGKWICELKKNGRDAKIVLEFDKESFTRTYIYDGRIAWVYKGVYRIDSAKKPKHLDLTITEDASKFQGETMRGIFALEGDTLKWCHNGPGKEERPSAFMDMKKPHRFANQVFKRSK